MSSHIAFITKTTTAITLNEEVEKVSVRRAVICETHHPHLGKLHSDPVPPTHKHKAGVTKCRRKTHFALLIGSWRIVVVAYSNADWKGCARDYPPLYSIQCRGCPRGTSGGIYGTMTALLLWLDGLLCEWNKCERAHQIITHLRFDYDCAKYSIIHFSPTPPASSEALYPHPRLLAMWWRQHQSLPRGSTFLLLCVASWIYNCPTFHILSLWI